MLLNLLRILPRSIASSLPLRNKPVSGFGYLGLIGDELKISYIKNGKVKTHTISLDGVDTEEKVRELLRKHLPNYKMVAAGLSEHEVVRRLASSLWLEEDIVSVKLKKSGDSRTVDVTEHIKSISAEFNGQNIANIRILDHNEVEVTDLVTLAEYQKNSSIEELATLHSLVKKFGERKISFVNATPQGGGVALMRHALIRLYRLLNVNASWYVMKPNNEVFNITKRKFHNVLQAVAESGVELGEEDMELYNGWIKENAEFLKPVFKDSDVIVIDDPQPCGLIPYIKKMNPKIKIIYRSHIQIEASLADTPGTPQYKTWQFLWQNIKLADLFVSHPVSEFVPKDVPKEKLVFMPATTDPLDGLNKPLNRRQMEYYLNLFNKLLKEAGQSRLDLKRPFIIQISRFDPSKGIPDVLEAYSKLCKKLKEDKKPLPQLVITGNGSVDDPDRMPIFNQIMGIIKSKDFSKIRKDIKVVPLPHIDQLLNTLLRASKIALQLSTKEGFEIKVTEALMKGKPIIAYRTGGIPLQIKDGVNGFVVSIGDTDLVAKHLFELLTDTEYYQNVSQAAIVYYDRSLLTVPNAIRWLELGTRVLKLD